MMKCEALDIRRFERGENITYTNEREQAKWKNVSTSTTVVQVLFFIPFCFGFFSLHFLSFIFFLLFFLWFCFGHSFAIHFEVNIVSFYPFHFVTFSLSLIVFVFCRKISSQLLTLEFSASRHICSFDLDKTKSPEAFQHLQNSAVG